LAVFLTPAWGLCQPAASDHAADAGRPSEAPVSPGQAAPTQPGNRSPDRRAFSDRRRDRPPPTETEWREAAESMKVLTPLAWARFEAIPKQAPYRARFMRRIVERHQELVRLKAHDPKRYEGEVEQLRIEDEILGLVIKFRQAKGADAEPLERELRAKVGQLVDLRFRNREARIDRLARTLEEERRRFEDDKRKRDQIIDRKFNGIINGPMGRRGRLRSPGADGGGRGSDAPAATPETLPDDAPEPELPRGQNPDQ
jgi:hypothetical protein